MGQYYKILNLDKKELLHPHKFGDGLKLLEFGASGSGAMLGLAVLLADGNNRGSGDLRSDNPLIGSWRRDRIIVAGDYADPEQEQEGAENLYQISTEEPWKDISFQVVEALCDDPRVLAEFKETHQRYSLANYGDLPKSLADKLDSPAKA